MRIGFANGCFDCFHEGHRHFIREAQERCDWLIIAVNSDESVKSIKGEGRPVDPLEKRIWSVGLRWDYGRMGPQAVIPFDGNPLPLLKTIRPDVLFRGEDQSTFHVERTLIGELVIIPRLPGLSTTQILQAHA